MKFRGGYNVLLQGRPGRAIKVLPEPDALYLPLRSRRFVFSRICVKDGQEVQVGQVLAEDAENFSVPLLAPRAGTVRLNKTPNHIVIEKISQADQGVYAASRKASKQVDSSDAKRHKLLTLGAWQFFYDAYTEQLPDPLGIPQAVIVSTVSLEPFLTRGNVQLRNRLLDFAEALGHLQSLLENQPVYLVVPNVKSFFASQIRQHIRGHASVKMLEIPLKYPYDNFNILARALKLKPDKGPVWAIRTEGVFAIDRALGAGQPCTERVVSVGGPAVNLPVHARAMPGYPIQMLLDSYVPGGVGRIINGGILTGRTIQDSQLGLDAECRGLTMLQEPDRREFLAFLQPGWNRRSYSGCFVSALMGKFSERLTTAVGGERRPCICCNFCQEVCPAGIMPAVIHKYLYQDLIEEAQRARVDLCVQCGLCSFVCPSKLELTEQFAEAQQTIQQESNDKIGV